MKTREEQLEELKQGQLQDLEGARALMEALYQQLGGTVTEDVTRQIKRLIVAILSAADADVKAGLLLRAQAAEERAMRAAPPPTDA
jgi:hypothetical protein